MKYSDCCGAACSHWEYGICPDCKEHCDFHDEDDFCPDCDELKEDCKCEKDNEVRDMMKQIYKNYPNRDYLSQAYRDYNGQIKKQDD